ncbi:MAG: hypothetical protein GY913_25355 [Proteobacteria bacterium]|nr:hypothetical protein [Pseudomonadota bacterium]MCP4920241.1 hypothetical protein [Pseudomonadota bacterium]
MFLLAALSLSTSEANACGMYIPDDYVLSELIEEMAEPVAEDLSLADLFLDLAPEIDEVVPEQAPSSQEQEQPLS